MNEAIGEKGGRRDRKRTLIITKENKEKLKEHNKEQEKLRIEKLEKKVRQQQIITFFKAVPIVIAGGAFKTLVVNTSKGKKIQNDNKKLKIGIETLDEKVKVSKLENNQINSSKLSKIEKEKNIIIHSNIVIKKEDIKKQEEVELLENISNIKNKNIDNRKTEIIEIKQNQIDIPTTNISTKKQGINIDPKNKAEILNNDPKKDISLSQEQELKDNNSNIKALENIKDKEILDKYEKKLKEVRSDLKKLDFEYMILAEESDKLYRKKDAEELLNKLNILINKINELKEKIKTNDFSPYDKNYLEEIIKDYIDEFNNKKVVKEIQDSPLYIMISEKLDELDGQKKDLKNKIEKKKNKLNIDEKKLKDLKEKYYDFNHINKILNDIRKDQEYELSILMEKVKNSKTEVEKVTYEIDAMTRQSNKLLRRMAILSLIPGIRSAKALATMTAYYMYMMKRVKNPNIKRRVTKEINIKDYHIDIESSIDKIDDANKLIGSTTSKLKREISKFKKDFKEYFSVLPECKTLLNNLNHVIDDLENKEKEIQEIKEKQSKLLKENNEKVLQYKNGNM